MNLTPEHEAFVRRALAEQRTAKLAVAADRGMNILKRRNPSIDEDRRAVKEALSDVEMIDAILRANP